MFLHWRIEAASFPAERLLLPVSGLSSREADTFYPLDVSISRWWSLSAIPWRVLMVSEGLLSQLDGVFTHAMTSLFYAEQRWGICPKESFYFWKMLATKFWNRGNNDCSVTLQVHLTRFEFSKSLNIIDFATRTGGTQICGYSLLETSTSRF